MKWGVEGPIAINSKFDWLLQARLMEPLTKVTYSNLIIEGQHPLFQPNADDVLANCLKDFWETVNWYQQFVSERKCQKQIIWNRRQMKWRSVWSQVALEGRHKAVFQWLSIMSVTSTILASQALERTVTVVRIWYHHSRSTKGWNRQEGASQRFEKETYPAKLLSATPSCRSERPRDYEIENCLRWICKSFQAWKLIERLFTNWPKSSPTRFQHVGKFLQEHCWLNSWHRESFFDGWNPRWAPRFPSTFVVWWPKVRKSEHSTNSHNSYLGYDLRQLF